MSIEHNIKSICSQINGGDIEAEHECIDEMMVGTLQYIADGGTVESESLQVLIDTFYQMDKWY